jgi:hypothetical protein
MWQEMVTAKIVKDAFQALLQTNGTDTKMPVPILRH